MGMWIPVIATVACTFRAAASERPDVSRKAVVVISAAVLILTGLVIMYMRATVVSTRTQEFSQ